MVLLRRFQRIYFFWFSPLKYIQQLNLSRFFKEEIAGAGTDLGEFPRNGGIPGKNCQGSSKITGNKQGEFSRNSPIVEKTGNSPLILGNAFPGNMQQRLAA